MENEASTSPQGKSKTLPIIIAVALIVIIIVGVLAYSMSGNNQNSQEVAGDQQAAPTQTLGDTQQQETPAAGDAMTADYEDGEYFAEGMYTSPGGEESIDVTLTLADGVVTEAEVVSNAVRPISKQMQAAFIGGFREQVIGKKIDEIRLTKVSTSSLAPKGFNNAVEKIKAQAKA